MNHSNMEKFEISEYDLENEFNPNRKRYKPSKDDATYGVFAGDQEEEEPMQPGIGLGFGLGAGIGAGRRGGGGGNTDYSQPLSFVSAGSEKMDIEEEMKKVTQQDPSTIPFSSVLPASFGAKKTVDPFATKSNDFAKKTARQQNDKNRRNVAVGQIDPAFAEWTKHTKGIGLKLLEKDNYVPGQGLGKDGKGIAFPIQAEVGRTKKGGVGFGPTTTHNKTVHVDSDDEQINNLKDQIKYWKNGANAEAPVSKLPVKKKKQRYGFESLSSQSFGQKQVQQTTKVIDMRGKDAKTFNNYNELADDVIGLDDGTKEMDALTIDTSMPELQHNLRILVDVSYSEVREIDTKLEADEDSLILLKQECKKVNKLVEKEQKQIQRLKEIKTVISDVKDRYETNAMDLDECIVLFRHLQTNFQQEFLSLDISMLALALVFPLVRKHLIPWNPLQQPTFGITMISIWKDILQKKNVSSSESLNRDMTVYERLLWEIWLPKIHSALSLWDARIHENMVKLIKGWQPLLPVWLMEHVVDQMLFPRLMDSVLKWNPQTDVVPIHLWLHPWISILGARMDPLYEPIRKKLGNALGLWNPADPSAHALLLLWKDVFSAADMERLVVQCILPKLQTALTQFVINPRNQNNIDLFKAIVKWSNIIPAKHLVTLLEMLFFPRWLNVLVIWLNNKPNHEEVANWYIGWKNLFPKELTVHLPIQNQFRRAVELMNAASNSSAPVVMPKVSFESPAYFENVEKRNHAELLVNEKLKKKMKQKTQETIEISLKELVAKAAEMNNLVFLPLNRSYKGTALFSFGSLVIYLDRTLIFVQDGRDLFNVISLEDLLKRAK